MNLKEEIFYGKNKKLIEASKLYHPIDENLNYSKELLTDIMFRRSYFIEGCEYQLKEQDNYAIEILEYYHNSLFFIPLKKGEAKKIVEHIKKEKNL